MEISHIRFFLSVCEHRSFTHAARAMNVSKPSIAKAIEELEHELGGPLLLRDGAECRLTQLGTIVYPTLQETLQQAHQVQAEATRHLRSARIPIGIGIGETIGQSKIAESIERYRANNPTVEIKLIVDNHAALLKGIREGHFDIAVTAAQPAGAVFQIDTLYEERYCVVVSAEHPLSIHETVALEMLAGDEMLDRLNCEMRELIRAASADRGYTLCPVYCSNHVDWLLELARNGAGFLILPETAVPKESGLVSLSIEDFQLDRQVAALRCRFQPSRPEVHDLVQELMKAS
ncbi:LysR family transcriptional regulator [Cognatiyoonia sp. IB215182]|uniref:LysR family transcriptional regulator n=1 Tax=Cognatiyoonia sp. IB215182 TaxID=3097353 RepID=UPI002A24574E|nr:LysR family transcriptional regulator [Cognatiyoonia sp. IB215182]